MDNALNIVVLYGPLKECITSVYLKKIFLFFSVSVGAVQPSCHGEDRPQVHRHHLQVWPRPLPDSGGKEGVHGAFSFHDIYLSLPLSSLCFTSPLDQCSGPTLVTYNWHCSSVPYAHSALIVTWFTLGMNLGSIQVPDQTSVRQGSGIIFLLFPVHSLGTSPLEPQME